MRSFLLTLFFATFIHLGVAFTVSAQDTLVEIKTNKGSIVVKLYDETPLHRDNFIKLVESQAYDNILFHRVIKGFMIQAGGNRLGGDETTSTQLDSIYRETIPAEFRYPELFHSAGKLCAARTGDDINPEKRSSSFHFYIVTGKFFLDHEINKMIAKGKNIPEALREVYKTEGGAPHLDGEYTVFGEVIKGMKTVIKIEASETDDNDAPLKPVFIKSMRIISK